MQVVLSIGANLGDAEGTLREVAVAAQPWTIALSSLWSTPPWGGVEQPDFLNAVLLVEHPEWGAWEWLRWGQECERKALRERDIRWGPRTLDVDVVAAGNAPDYKWVSDHEELNVPHPRAHERAFVLRPWWEIEPDALLGGVPIRSLLDALPPADTQGISLLQESWGGAQ